MKLLILVACSVWAAEAAAFLGRETEAGDVDDWEHFKLRYNKTYKSDEEEKFRKMIYMDNKLTISKHNEKFQKGEVTFELGVNIFSDMLHEEFVKLHNGYKKSNRIEFNRNFTRSTFKLPSNVEVADEVNWVTKGAVTPVKDQGSCGSCWAFSSTGSLEGQHFRKTGTLTSLSEQNLIDCSFSEGNEGCGGGDMSEAYLYVSFNGGIDKEASYPYEGEVGTCRYNPDNSGATDRGLSHVVPRDEKTLKAAVATIGPISVAIDASHLSFQNYKKGVYVEPECKNFLIDHAVLVVGYGTDQSTNQDYWLVKNSWGETWGEDGYIRMLRNGNNQCGIASDASYPLV